MATVTGSWTSPRSYIQEAEEYRQTQAKWAELERGQLANALLQEKLSQEEQERRTKQMVLDMLQGYGTPGERAAEQYKPVSPALSQALRTGQMVTNVGVGAAEEQQVAPQVGPEGVSGGRFYTPSPSYASQVQGLSPNLLNALARSVLGIKGETPEETLGRERELHGMDIAGRAETQKAMDVRQAATQEKVDVRQQKAAEWRQEIEDKRSKLNFATQMLVNRQTRLEQQSIDAQRIRDTMQIKTMMSPEYLGLARTPERQREMLQRVEDEYQGHLKRVEKQQELINTQLNPLLAELGITPHPGPQAPTVDPVAVFGEYMRKRLKDDEHTYTFLNMSGLDARGIMLEAQRKNTTPEKYLEALLEVRRRRAKLSR